MDGQDISSWSQLWKGEAGRVQELVETSPHYHLHILHGWGIRSRRRWHSLCRCGGNFGQRHISLVHVCATNIPLDIGHTSLLLGQNLCTTGRVRTTISGCPFCLRRNSPCTSSSSSARTFTRPHLHSICTCEEGAIYITGPHTHTLTNTDCWTTTSAENSCTYSEGELRWSGQLVLNLVVVP